MFIRFQVENFRSILDPAELSMVAVDDRPEVWPKPRLGVSLLPVAGIFGPNASGKSNLLRALLWLRTAVVESLREWDEQIPVEPFAFGNDPQRDSSFILEFEIGGVRFEYLLDLGRYRVSYEALFHYPERRRRKIFEREGNELALQRGLGALAGTRALLTDRSLALSIMRRFDEPLTSRFAAEVARIGSIGPAQSRRDEGLTHFLSTVQIFDPEWRGQPTPVDSSRPEFFSDAKARRREALALLKLADLGVSDVEVAPDRSDISNRRKVSLVHGTGAQKIAFDYRDESAGTQMWFQLIGPVLTALHGGRLVLFDELDGSLHPTLTAQLVRMFTSHATNTAGAQLVFTAHDTNLLNELNRDEVWLTEKRPSGATAFGPLSDFAGERVRRSVNIKSGYLSGRFGALPEVSRPEVLRELGAIE